MELSGPKVIVLGSVVEFRMVYEKKIKNLSFRLIDPSGKESVPNVSKMNDPTVCLLTFATSSVGFYKVNVMKSNSTNILISKQCFAYDLKLERWHIDKVHWTLEEIELTMEMRRHHPIANYISAQAHLKSAINNSINPNVVIKCNHKILPDKNLKFSFTPPQFGSYEIRFFCNNSSMPGPRPHVHFINTRKWKLIHSFTTDECLTSLNKKASFIFELYGSPSKFLKVWIECPNKKNVEMLLYGEDKSNKIGQLRCDFTPTDIGLHSLIGLYKDAMFDKCPLEFHVYDSRLVEIVSIEPDLHIKSNFNVGETIKLTYNCLNAWSGKLEVTADAGDVSGIYSSVPVEKLVLDRKGIVTFSVKLEVPGNYLIESFYNKEKIDSFEVEVKSKSQNGQNDSAKNATKSPSQELLIEEFSNPTSSSIESSQSGTLTSDEVSKSILFFDANDRGSSINKKLPVISGNGLTEPFVEERAIFIVDPQKESGKLTVDVIGPKSLEKCLIKPDSVHNRYEVEYYPKEIGLYQITILWNGQPLPGSPFKAEATDPKSIQCISHEDIFNNVLQIPTGRKTKVEFSYSLAGKGRMSASVKKRNVNSIIRTWTTVTKSVWTFWINAKERDSFSLEIIWNTRLLGVVKVVSENDNLPPEIGDDPETQILLKGRGLRESWLGEVSKFQVDAFNFENESLVVEICSTNPDDDNIPVTIEKQPNGIYECQYQPTCTGQYLLNIAWGEKVVKGSPFFIYVKKRDPAKDVECEGDGLKHGFVGETSAFEIKINNYPPNNTSNYKPDDPKISVSCTGPDENYIICDILKKSSSHYLINMKPQIPGRHKLEILYGDSHVPGSPFYPFYTDKECLEKLKVYGPGLKSSHLKNFQSHFTVDTTEAGAGKLRVQVKGPKEAFRVEVQKNPTDTRLIKCSYNPTEIGEYTISISWSGCPIKESPFKILLV